uniref:NACHT domain-containing protein n=1 Tax=Amphimedon queenslandica TaxID=400682 RepID=A0A1X7TG25_AMPQE
MIDVSQWRTSIGLWNYCQAAFSRPANGRHSHSFKAAVDSKSGSTTSGEKTSKLPAALSLIVSLLLSSLRYVKLNFIPPTGKQTNSIITVTVMIHCLQSLVLFIATIGSSSDLIYYLVLLLLLLLSGDVELNPGPMIDGQPFCPFFAKYLEPLDDWEPFALSLPGGIAQLDVDIIKTKGSSYLRMEALHKRWLQVNPTASWRDVINALKQCKENELAKTIEDKVTDPTAGRSSNDDMEVSTSSANPGPITGNPKDILRTHADKLAHAISVNLYNVTDALYAKDLIPQQTKEEMHVSGVTNNEKSSKLVNVIEQQLKSSLNPEQYLIDICHVLINQQHYTLTDIATSILHQLGQPIPDNVSSPIDDIVKYLDNFYMMYLAQLQRGQSVVAKPVSSIPDDVQGYADNMRQRYKHQPIVATDWPPRIGKDFFGRLALVEKQDSSTQAKSAWHLLRGQVDEIVKLTGNKEISVKDVLQPTDSSLPLRVVIDGPPGIGKTTLCRKLLNMWSNGPLGHQQYDLVLYCPLRNSKIATATKLADLLEYRCYEVHMVAEWFEKRNGEGLLIIFDGWDELSEQLRQSSLAASIIHRKQLDQCAVIVTSRSYASSSLLKMDTLSRHVQVIGFSKEEISTVIIQTLQKDTKLAQELIDKKREDDNDDRPFTTFQSSKDSQLAVKLINDLQVRNDVQSLCYVPLVCSMAILVYCKEGGHLPTTLTQLYENFILQTIRRHVEIKPRHDIDPYTLGSLSSLPSQLAKPLQEMCQLAYTNLANTRMTFSSHQVQSLSEAVKEDYLGLMTAFTEYDEKKYQFLHLSIQEFLAAWWIAKHEKKTEEVFKDHFDDDHFRMCLRFVAGLTHLEHESYQHVRGNHWLDLRLVISPTSIRILNLLN